MKPLLQCLGLLCALRTSASVFFGDCCFHGHYNVKSEFVDCLTNPLLTPLCWLSERCVTQPSDCYSYGYYDGVTDYLNSTLGCMNIGECLTVKGQLPDCSPSFSLDHLLTSSSYECLTCCAGVNNCNGLGLGIQQPTEPADVTTSLTLPSQQLANATHQSTMNLTSALPEVPSTIDATTSTDVTDEGVVLTTARRCVSSDLSNSSIFAACLTTPVPQYCYSAIKCNDPYMGCYVSAELDTEDNVCFTSGCINYDECQFWKGEKQECSLFTIEIANIVGSNLDCVSCCDGSNYCNNLLPGMINFALSTALPEISTDDDVMATMLTNTWYRDHATSIVNTEPATLDTSSEVQASSRSTAVNISEQVSEARRCIFSDLSNSSIISACLTTPVPQYCYSAIKCNDPYMGCYVSAEHDTEGNVNLTSGCINYDECQFWKGERLDCSLYAIEFLTLYEYIIDCVYCCDGSNYCNNLLPGMINFALSTASPEISTDDDIMATTLTNTWYRDQVTSIVNTEPTRLDNSSEVHSSSPSTAVNISEQFSEGTAYSSTYQGESSQGGFTMTSHSLDTTESSPDAVSNTRRVDGTFTTTSGSNAESSSHIIEYSTINSTPNEYSMTSSVDVHLGVLPSQRSISEGSPSTETYPDNTDYETFSLSPNDTVNSHTDGMNRTLEVRSNERTETLSYEGGLNTKATEQWYGFTSQSPVEPPLTGTTKPKTMAETKTTEQWTVSTTVAEREDQVGSTETIILTIKKDSNSTEPSTDDGQSNRDLMKSATTPLLAVVPSLQASAWKDDTRDENGLVGGCIVGCGVLLRQRSTKHTSNTVFQCTDKH
ncbi:uncharacterized protein [Apostichopus japonicus]|uniref:uncharacterized protein n=1 Tax=Stichopus japonicus TaxID=307972 RepID=UPI003AB5D0CB